MKTELKLWHVDDGGESYSVVAADEDDALKVIIEAGYAPDDVDTPESYRCSCCGIEISEKPGDFELTITLEAEGEGGSDLKVRKTAREWIDQEGRCLLGSTCW